jgi:hypothetical protein
MLSRRQDAHRPKIVAIWFSPQTAQAIPVDDSRSSLGGGVLWNLIICWESACPVADTRHKRDDAMMTSHSPDEPLPDKHPKIQPHPQPDRPQEALRSADRDTRRRSQYECLARSFQRSRNPRGRRRLGATARSGDYRNWSVVAVWSWHGHRQGYGCRRWGSLNGTDGLTTTRTLGWRRRRCSPPRQRAERNGVMRLKGWGRIRRTPNQHTTTTPRHDRMAQRPRPAQTKEPDMNEQREG